MADSSNSQATLGGPEPELSVAEIKFRSARGGAVTMLAQVGALLLQLTSTVVLARLLQPADYGVIAMVTAVTAFAGLFRDFGLSASTVQRETITREQLSTLYWITVAIGAAVTIAVAAAAPVVVWFYRRPELSNVTAMVSLNFFVSSFGSQPAALLMRQMRFGRLAVANTAGPFVGLVVSLSMAVTGFAYWALVYGGLASAAVTAGLTNLLCSWHPEPPRTGSGVRSMLKYGANLTAFDVVNYFHRNLDNILIGRIWGANALGLYSRAYSLLMFPINNIRGPLNAVAFPAMSRLQNQPLLLKAYYRRVTLLVAFFSMPIMAFLFIRATPVILLTLGSQWLGVVPIFSALAVTGFIQPVVTMFGLVVLSAGLGRRYLKLGIFNATCMCLGFVIGSAHGARGVAMGYGVATYLSAYPLLYWTFKGLPIGLKDFGEAIVRPAISSLVAAAATAVIAAWLSSIPLVLALAFEATGFGLIFILAFASLPGGRDEIRKLIAMKELFRRLDPVEGP